MAESKGFDLRCGAGRLRLQSAPGALLRAFGFAPLLDYAKSRSADGTARFWCRWRGSNPHVLADTGF